MTNLIHGVRSDPVSGPPAGTWDIDPDHAEVAFVGRHLMLTKARGRFTGVQGAITVGDDLADSVVEVTIDMASVETGNHRRDEHLRSDELFDVERYPVAIYRSTGVAWEATEASSPATSPSAA
jgi:polyisoprenoid-binding protein YceI